MSAKFWRRLAHECELWQKGLTLVAGADEAGCGPLAGPVVAAAVVFPCAWRESGLYSKLRGLNDSKQLTEEERANRAGARRLQKLFHRCGQCPGQSHSRSPDAGVG